MPLNPKQLLFCRKYQKDHNGTKAAVRARMWPAGEGARQFKNATHFITGAR